MPLTDPLPRALFAVNLPRLWVELPPDRQVQGRRPVGRDQREKWWGRVHHFSLGALHLWCVVPFYKVFKAVKTTTTSLFFFLTNFNKIINVPLGLSVFGALQGVSLLEGFVNVLGLSPS